MSAPLPSHWLGPYLDRGWGSGSIVCHHSPNKTMWTFCVLEPILLHMMMMKAISSICIYYIAQPTKSTYKIIKWKQIVDGILHKTILTYCRKYELCCNIAVYIYIENRLFSPLLACFSIFVVVFGGFQFASEFTIVTVIVCFPGGLCFGETEATLCVSFVTFCDYITYNYHYWLEY